jgi:16S rRNA (cytidine1402-2'-O)-methyltransferase
MVEQDKGTAVLYIVATPIGNFGDFSPRAVEVLRSVMLIAAEDTRHSAKLLQQFGITTRTVSCHDFSTGKQLRNLIARLESGESIALISDAGTPAISDPGYLLVKLARERGIRVSPVPGASALLAALSVAGLPTDRFVFAGFLPAKKAARRKALQAFKLEQSTQVFFESPHRIVACLRDIVEICGASRQLFIGREMTKLFETTMLDTAALCLSRIESNPDQQKGEFVLVLSGESQSSAESQVEQEGLRVLACLLPEMSTRQAATLAAKISGASRNALYAAALRFSK